ncbi:MAG: hypothetical protein ACT4P6_01470 [Gemmatimonadaceae bacterium]
MARPYRPFAGQRLENQAVEIAPSQTPENVPELEAWETILDATPALSASEPELILENDAAGLLSSAPVEVQPFEALEEPPPIFTEFAIDFDHAGLRSPEPESVASPDPEETVEVPAYDTEIADEVPVELPPRTAFETPIFVAPTRHPAAESSIDEIDAAFISAGLPSTNDSGSDHARAAEVLERIARRLRAGEIKLPQAIESNAVSEEATLAAVLAALLANR